MTGLYTAREVAEHFGVEPGTVLDWHQAGKIPDEAVMYLGGTPGGRKRFRLDIIEAAWQKRSGAGGEAPATPSTRPTLGVVSGLPAIPIEGGEDA